MANEKHPGTDRPASPGRRALIKSSGLAAASTALAAGAAGPSLAGLTTGGDADPRLRSFDARYAIHGGAIIDGYFSMPRSRNLFDVLLLVPDAAGITPSLKAAARRQALGGAFVIVPDLAATASGTARRAGYDAMVAELVAQVPNLKRLPRSNGRVRVLAG